MASRHLLGHRAPTLLPLAASTAPHSSAGLWPSPHRARVDRVTMHCFDAEKMSMMRFFDSTMQEIVHPSIDAARV